VHDLYELLQKKFMLASPDGERAALIRTERAAAWSC
jgi:hypothetical protein